MCMDDPTGGMWIYFIFFLIPLARILPRIIRKFKNKAAASGGKPEKFEEKPMWRPKPPKKEREPFFDCLLYTSPSPRDLSTSRMPSSA